MRARSRRINFYNDVRDPSARKALFQLDLHEPHIPTQGHAGVRCSGDSNTHSPSCPLPGATTLAWARDLEDWAATQLLQLANPEQVPRRLAQPPARDSIIDLVWYNDAVVLDNTCTPPTVDRAASLGSDHAALLFTVSADPLPPQEPVADQGQNLGYIADPSKREEWAKHLISHASLPPHMSDPPTPQECDADAADVARTNEAVFDKRKGGISKGYPWWDAECDAAAQTVHCAPPGEAKDIASAALRSAVRKAKRL